MTTTDVATTDLEAKVDLLTQQMAVLTADAEERRRQRESLQDLGADLSRVSEGAMAVATRELESMSATVDFEDTVRLLRRLVEVAPTLDKALVSIDQMAALVDDAMPLAPEMMALATDRLARAEERGYFAFAKAGAGVADRVVASFDEDDLSQLGDNVVTILETIKEVTQPEMLALLGQMIEAVKHEQDEVDLEPADAPSLWSLAKKVRDPDVRRGIARALGTLRAVSVETRPEAQSPTPNASSQGER